MGIDGTLPDSWASTPGAFQSLRILYLCSVNLVGTIPASWGSTQGFPFLKCLWLDDSLVRGRVPAFDNVNLAILILSNMSLTPELNVFWSSSAPLTQVDLSFNYIEGYLPADAPILHMMQFLKMRWNSLQGTVPLLWLQEGGVLSHMPFMDLGQIWHDSVAQTDWRQDLCLRQDLYEPDVTAQQISQLPDLIKRLEGRADPNENRLQHLADDWLKDHNNFLASFGFAKYLQSSTNQLTDVKSICANQDAGRWLLAVWAGFGGCCVGVVVAYACLRWCTGVYAVAYLTHNSFLAGFWAMVSPLSGTAYGLASLAFYYYDLITGMVVLTQVWGKWPGWILLSIFLFHLPPLGPWSCRLQSYC